MKKHISWMILVAFMAVPMAFNSCDGSHSDGSLNSSSMGAASACLPVLEPGVKPVFDHLQPKCSSCHFKGSSAAPADYYFADANFTDAMSGFVNIGPSKLYDKAYSNHFGGAGTPEMTAALEPLKAPYEAAHAAYLDCLSKQVVGPQPPGANAGYEPTKKTINKTIPANPTNPVNITWNLGSEMETAGAAIAGAQFQVTVRSVLVPNTTTTQYYITAPSARGATNSAIQIQNVRVFINNSLVGLSSGGGTWISLNNLAPASRLHPLPQGTGTMVIEMDTSVANTIAIGFGDIKVSTQYPDFNPTTYSRLTNANAAAPAGTAVFQQRCQSCHGNSGGVSLATGGNNLLLLKLTGHVVPYVPQASSVFGLMNLPAGDPLIMPPAGRAADEEIRWVRDWILDGAPN